MTDYIELKKRLLEAQERKRKEREEADSALEAQAKEIAEKDARIAELEAALKELREAAYDVDDEKMFFIQRRRWERCLAKVDEALKGEKL